MSKHEADVPHTTHELEIETVQSWVSTGCGRAAYKLVCCFGLITKCIRTLPVQVHTPEYNIRVL